MEPFYGNECHRDHTVVECHSRSSVLLSFHPSMEWTTIAILFAFCGGHILWLSCIPMNDYRQLLTSISGSMNLDWFVLCGICLHWSFACRRYIIHFDPLHTIRRLKRLKLKIGWRLFTGDFFFQWKYNFWPLSYNHRASKCCWNESAPFGIEIKV